MTPKPDRTPSAAQGQDEPDVRSSFEVLTEDELQTVEEAWSAASTLFQPRTEEGAIDLMVSDGPKRCICCPPHHQHVFAYGHALPGTSAGGYPRHADDLVRDVLHEAFRATEDAAAVNRMRVRVTVELLPEEAS